MTEPTHLGPAGWVILLDDIESMVEHPGRPDALADSAVTQGARALTAAIGRQWGPELLRQVADEVDAEPAARVDELGRRRTA